MVLLTLVDISVSTAWWVTKNVYYAGKYMIYGRQKTEAEIIKEDMTEQMDKILKNEEELKNELRELNGKKIEKKINLRHSL
jgi:hypothetical protein